MLIYGTKRPDNLYGTELDDQIFGRAGDDSLVGGRGNDFMHGGKGNDYLYSFTTGDDELHGGQGDDVLFDRDAGADFLFGERGNDQLYGDAIDYQRDVLHGGPDNDVVNGGTGFDLLIGGAGSDIISGMGGEYYGDAAPGTRFLAAGNDQMFTDLASDYGTPRIMTGGQGADMFWITTNSEGVATAVTVTDFTNGEDHFYLYQHTPAGLTGFDLDSNRNGHLDAGDGWSSGGNVSVDNNSLTLTVGDGDSVRFLNNDHVDWFI